MLPWNNDYKVATVVIENTFYNANFDLFSYVVLEFNIQS